MLAQYTLPEMGKVFSSENRYQLMLDVSVIACEALADIGRIPNEAYQEIKAKADISPKRIKELEEEGCNKSMAFLASLSEKVGDAARYLQLGICYVDIADTVLALQLRQACELLQSRLNQLRKLLSDLAHEYKYTLMMGRTHGTNAEPTTFGLKLALWVREVDRSLTRLNHARLVATHGKMSGPVGTFSSIDPHVETFVCRRLGLHPAFVTNQSLQRDRIAEFISTLAIIGGSLEKFSIEIRNLQRSDIREVEELLLEGQSGSTSMPHKRRPYESEVISGLARILRGNALASLESQAMWHEYDSTHSSVERVTVPDSCIVLDYMLNSFIKLMENLRVYPETMRENIDNSLGLVFSQRVMLALMDKGVSREQAYEMVMRNANTAWEQQCDFQFLLLQDKQVRKFLSNREIMDLFDYDCFRKHIDFIFARGDI
ncbi:MAG: adenylosuccinate lyase [Firmicutes bacterium]|nr:adenylosuccinate lyase [Bacillota bacterium]